MIFRDPHLERPLDEAVVWEGFTYYLDLSSLSPDERERIIEDARLGTFAEFNKRNNVCSFAIDGYVGSINLAGRQLDVRSRKFEVERPGNEQFKLLLTEIDAIIAGLTFRYESVARHTGVEISARYQPSLLERLDFFRTNMRGPVFGASIVGTVDRILADPHSALRTERSEDSSARAGKIDMGRYAMSVARQGLAQVAVGSAASNSLAVITAKNGAKLLPQRVPTTRVFISHDTAENRFVRFFLEDIESVCLAVLRQRTSSELASRDAKSVLRQTRELLANPILSGIGKLHLVPSHSPVLTSHPAYSRIYELSLRSRCGVIDLLEHARRQLRSSPLKDIATLYEIWVFFKLAAAFLGTSQELLVTSYGGGGLSYGTTWGAGDISVSYNKTFAAPDSSYSVSFRPDVTVQRADRIWLFDAKYKSDRLVAFNEDDDAALVSASVTKPDIHKMHTYVDAIKGSGSAIAVYPGTDAIFFPRVRASGDALLDMCKLGGVGGMPMLPSNPNKLLKKFVAAILNGAASG